MNDEQKEAMYAVLGMVLSDDEDDDEKGGNVVKHNIFDNEEREQANKSILSHSDEMKIVSMAKQSGIGSLRAAMNIFAEENAGTLAHGVFDDEVEKLFPEYELLKKVSRKLLPEISPGLILLWLKFIRVRIPVSRPVRLTLVSLS